MKIGTRIRKEERELMSLAKGCGVKILELTGVVAELLNTKSVCKKQLQEIVVFYKV